jgi:hypothetical protein
MDAETGRTQAFELGRDFSGDRPGPGEIKCLDLFLLSATRKMVGQKGPYAGQVTVPVVTGFKKAA